MENTEWAGVEDHGCRDCEQVITNPICPGCIARGVEQWALIWMPEILPKLNINPSYGTGTHCIFCQRDMSLCAHCYSREIYDMVVEAIPELGGEFLQHFNFELRQTLN